MFEDNRKRCLKLCTKCNKQFTNLDEFHQHETICGKSDFKQYPKKAKSPLELQREQSKPYKNVDLEKYTRIEEGFAALDVVTKGEEDLTLTDTSSAETIESNTNKEDVVNVENVLQDIQINPETVSNITDEEPKFKEVEQFVEVVKIGNNTDVSTECAEKEIKQEAKKKGRPVSNKKK